MPKDIKRARARELRADGHSYDAIAALLGVSKSSVSLWVRDLPRPTTVRQDYEARMAGLQRYFADRRARVGAEREAEVRRWSDAIGPLSERELMIAGAVAYWAEGSKSKPWRHDETVAFINSDPDMVTLFMSLTTLWGITADRLTFRVQIHETADERAAVAYWANLVGVEPTSFARSTIKRHRPLSPRRNTAETYHGCLTVRVRLGTPTYRRIEGTWWAVCRTAGLAREADNVDPCDPGSSNGRTPAFGAGYAGSTPAPGARTRHRRGASHLSRRVPLATPPTASPRSAPA